MELYQGTIEQRPKYQVKYLYIRGGKATIQKKHIYLGTNLDLPLLQAPQSVLTQSGVVQNNGRLRAYLVHAAFKDTAAQANAFVRYADNVTVGANNLPDSILHISLKHAFVGFMTISLEGQQLNTYTSGGIEYAYNSMQNRIDNYGTTQNSPVPFVMLCPAAATASQKAVVLLSQYYAQWHLFEPMVLTRFQHVNNLDMSHLVCVSRDYNLYGYVSIDPPNWKSQLTAIVIKEY